MFLHLSVILLTGGACVVKWGGMRGEVGGVHGEGGHAWQRGACVVKGGHAWQRGGMRGKGGVRAWQRGACVVCMPPQDMAGQCTGGTHPTGMHSCVYNIFACY